VAQPGGGGDVNSPGVPALIDRPVLPRGLNNARTRFAPTLREIASADLEFDVDMLATRTHVQNVPPEEIVPTRLPDLLDLFPGVRALSLDCFDTLLWRFTDRPQDVFHIAAQRSAFRAYGVSAAARVQAEVQARQLAVLRGGHGEVGLAEIYRAHRRDLTDSQVAELAEDELAAEMESCYAHPATSTLLRSAAQRNVPVAIVSDTYLDEPSLRRLLTRCVPPDALAAIRRIVCSSEYGRSKSQGLLRLAYKEKPCNSSILHVGDNRQADFEAARRAGLQAVHLIHQRVDEARRADLRATALSVLVPEVRHRRPMLAPYRAVSSLRTPAVDPAVALGESVIGPILHSFAQWVENERRDICARFGRARLFFLLRDGHLPYQVHHALHSAPDCHAVRISRFTALAASFRKADDIERYLAKFIATGRFETLARQLLLEPEVAARLVGDARRASNPVRAFGDAVRRPDVIRSIVAASARVRERMWRYLQRETGVASGETVVFVDLGYVGTAQRVLQPVFAEEWGVRLKGRYFLWMGESDDDHKGLIDRSWCDDRAIASLVSFVSVIENLCSGAGGSVCDYDADGRAVLQVTRVDARQMEVVEKVQAGCLDFAHDAEDLLSRHCAPPGPWLREAALAEFARFVYFPEHAELEILRDFSLDINMGTEDSLRLFDRDAVLEGLRRRGINALERNSGMRLQYPAELRAASLELSMALLAQYRFSLTIPLASWTHRHEDLVVLIARGDGSKTDTVRASATHDGFFSVVFPLGKGDMHIGIALGQSYAWLQVHGIEVLPQRELASVTESLFSVDIGDRVLLDGIRDHGDGLYECEGIASLLLVPAGLSRSDEPCVCRFVFRPVIRRKPSSVAATGGQPPGDPLQ